VTKPDNFFSSFDKKAFTLPLNNGMTVAEAKVAFFEYYKKSITEDQECKFKDVELLSPENIRMRHLYSKYPSTVLFDTQLMKEVSRGVMSSIELAIQKLPIGEMEPKMSKETIIVFMQQFIPSKFEFGDRFEFQISNDDDLDDLRARLNQRCGCENIALAEAERYEIISLLSLDNLDWHEPKETKEKVSLRESRSSYKTKVKILSAKDGYIIIFKDCKEELKQLTEDEKKMIREKERKNNQSSIGPLRFHKERSLRIRQTDIELEEDEGGDLKINTDVGEDDKENGTNTNNTDTEKEKTN